MTTAEYALTPLALACGCRETWQHVGDVNAQLKRYTRLLAQRGEFEYAHEEGDSSMHDDMHATTQKVWRFIAAYVGEHGYPPANREIAAAVGLASVSTVPLHLQHLQAAGVIRHYSRTARGIQLLKQPEAA